MTGVWICMAKKPVKRIYNNWQVPEVKKVKQEESLEYKCNVACKPIPFIWLLPGSDR